MTRSTALERRGKNVERQQNGRRYLITTRTDWRSTGSYFRQQQIFDRILRWLAGFIHLTEEEQKDAGIYLGNQRDQ